MIMTNLTFDEMFSKKMFQAHDMLSLADSLLQKYFLDDFFGQSNLVKDSVQMHQIVGFMQEMLWMTNNLIVHEN